MLSFVLRMVDVDKRFTKVEPVQILVAFKSNLFKNRHVIVVLNHLVVRAAQPRKAERVAEGGVDYRREELDGHLVNCFGLGA